MCEDGGPGAGRLFGPGSTRYDTAIVLDQWRSLAGYMFVERLKRTKIEDFP